MRSLKTCSSSSGRMSGTNAITIGRRPLNAVATYSTLPWTSGYVCAATTPGRSPTLPCRVVSGTVARVYGPPVRSARRRSATSRASAEAVLLLKRPQSVHGIGGPCVAVPIDTNTDPPGTENCVIPVPALPNGSSIAVQPAGCWNEKPYVGDVYVSGGSDGISSVGKSVGASVGDAAAAEAGADATGVATAAFDAGVVFAGWNGFRPPAASSPSSVASRAASNSTTARRASVLAPRSGNSIVGQRPRRRCGVWLAYVCTAALTGAGRSSVPPSISPRRSWSRLSLIAARPPGPARAPLVPRAVVTSR